MKSDSASTARPALFISSENFGNAIIGGTAFSTPVATFRSQGRYTNTYNLADNAGYYRGKHNIQFGFQMQRDYTDPYNDAGITPTYTVGISTANTFRLDQRATARRQFERYLRPPIVFWHAGRLCQFLLADVQRRRRKTSGFVNGYTQDRHWEFTNYSGYVVDTWRVKNNLTVNLGVRYEYYSPVTEQNGLVLLPQLGQQQRADHVVFECDAEFRSRHSRSTTRITIISARTSAWPGRLATGGKTVVARRLQLQLRQRRIPGGPYRKRQHQRRPFANGYQPHRARQPDQRRLAADRDARRFRFRARFRTTIT